MYSFHFIDFNNTVFLHHTYFLTRWRVAILIAKVAKILEKAVKAVLSINWKQDESTKMQCFWTCFYNFARKSNFTYFSINMKKVFIIITLLAMVCGNSVAQSVVFGNVQDAFLKTPLPEAKVSLLLASDSTIVIDSIPITKKYRDDGTVRQAQFMLEPEKKTCKYLLRATLKGYDDGWQTLSIDEKSTKAVMLDEPLALRKSREIELREVVVKATKVKMYYKGDTIVYDATAFKLPDGSMLDDLIHQMPGVTMSDDGQIFVNGRLVEELQLGSRTFMRGNKKVLMENLPYFTVKDIKVYEQDTDLNRAMGTQVERKKFVMDVNLKPEYQMGYLANVEAAGGTQDRWLGRGFLFGFTDRTRYTLHANSNNVNESRHIGRSDHWTPDAVPQSLLTTHSVAGEIDYQTADKNVQENLTADFTSTRDKGEMLKVNNLFVYGNPLQTTHQNTFNKGEKLKIGNHFKYVKPNKYYIESDAAFNYRTYSGNSSILQEQFIDTLTILQRIDGLNDGKALGANGYLRLQPTLKKIGNLRQYFRFSTSFDYSSDVNEHAKRFQVDDFLNHSNTKQHNSNDYSLNKVSVHTPIYYSFENGLNQLFLDINPSYSRDKTRDWLYHPDTLILTSQMDMLSAMTDPNNSYNSDLRTYKADIELHLARAQHIRKPYDLQEHFIDLYLTARPTHERLSYQRGMIDTLSTRNTMRFDQRLEIRLFKNKDHSRRGLIRLQHYEQNSSLVNQLAFRDDANPLVVRLGNPDLKPWTSVSSIYSEYEDWKETEKSYWFGRVSAQAGYLHQEVVQAISFNPATGVYTYRPENAHGTYDLKANANITGTLGRGKRWTVASNLDGRFVHWMDHTMLAGETESHLNAVNTLTLHDNVYIQYSKDKLNVRATGDIRWRHSEGQMYDFETLNAFDYKYGLSGRYTIPGINMTVSADANMFSRRGYGSSALNTDDFVVNASISQPFLKGKLIARIEAFDLFHQLSNTQYEVNAQGRTETWYRSLHHYVMAHVAYHWNKNPKKK